MLAVEVDVVMDEGSGVLAADSTLSYHSRYLSPAGSSEELDDFSNEEDVLSLVDVLSVAGSASAIEESWNAWVA